MLSQQILDVGNEIVKSYKSDLDIDVEYCGKHPNSQIVWMLSETGTQVVNLTIPSDQKEPDECIGFHKAIEFIEYAALSGQCQYDHFYLIFTGEDDQGSIKPLTVEELKSLLEERKKQVPLVIPDRSNWLQVKCTDHYQKVRQFAEENGLLEQLEGKLNQLRDMSSRYYYYVELSEDFAENSFFWVQWYKVDGEWKRGMHGGLIYHDFLKSWSIHT